LKINLFRKLKPKINLFEKMNRNHNLQRLRNETFDICIIGGGASGTGCALDAALRGYKVALIERDDFAAETSSKSTKLIHGGVRYLEQAFKNLDFAQLKQVKHGLEERHIMLENAPHLAQPLALITPVRNWAEGMYYRIGLTMYGWFAGSKDTLPTSRFLDKKAILERIPTLHPKTYGGILYYDGQFDDARYCLALAQTADEAGAACVNHAEVIDFQKDTNGQLMGATVRDTLKNDFFQIKAQKFINCTGAGADVIRKKANPAVSFRMRPSKGVHVVLPHAVLNSQQALMIPKTPDGRIVFAIPFDHKLMLGTTDEPYLNGQEEPLLEQKEVDYLIETLQPYLAQTIDKQAVTAGFGGLRPLIAGEPNKATKRLLRDHEVEIEEVTGLISLLGGKWTTYRLMAQDTINAVDDFFQKTNPCKTESKRLVGAEGYNEDFCKKIVAKYQLEADICLHLGRKYGTQAEKILQLAVEQPFLARRFNLKSTLPIIKAEIVYQIRVESACTLRDILARRLRLEITDWATTMELIVPISQLLAVELDWSEAERLKAVSEYQILLKKMASTAMFS
jgi:glycerol-3-phosphate dehydrogenase